LKTHNPCIDWRSRKITFWKEDATAKSSINLHIKKPLFVEARVFIRSVKNSTPFVIYTTPTSEDTTSSTSIPEQYKEFQDVFQKKNADMLLQHRPYDCAIDLQEGAQPPFGPIYNLLQTELAEL